MGKNRKLQYVVGISLIVLFVAFVFIRGFDEDDVAKWPERPIEWVLAVSPGGGTDIFARNLAMELKEVLGVDIRIVNMPGESTAHAIEQPIDGYTWTATDEIAIVPVYIEDTKFHFQSWTPIAIVQQDPRWIVVLDSSPFNDIQEVIKHAQDKRLTIGGVAPFGPDFCLTFFLNQYAGTNIQYVPYNSTAEVITAAKGGVIDLIAGSLVSFVPQLEAGELKLLMVAAEERIKRFPDVPTAKELGHDIVIASYRGIGVHIDTPLEIKEKLAKAVEEAVQSEAFQKYEVSNYLDLVPGVLYFDDALARLENVYEYTSTAYKALRSQPKK
jgi:putative tricarboxylic transport membrane protein